MTKEKQFQFDTKYLRMAKIWAENSYAERRKVGCLIVKDNMIISDGYNGCPSGFENDCETLKCGFIDEFNMCPKDLRFIESSISKDKCKGCPYFSMTTKPYVLHAESNAITKLAKSNNSSVGATLYVTLSPCLQCAKLIIQSGIVRVVYIEKYRITDGLDLLERAGIEVVQIEEDKLN